MKKYIMQQIMSVSHICGRKCGAVFNANGISRGQPPILEFLYANDGCIQRDLADHCYIDPASVTSVLAGMEAAGLIRREQVKDDRRALSVFLTEEGRRAAELVGVVHMERERVSLQGFTTEEKENLENYCQRIKSNLKREDDGAHDDKTI